MTRRIGERSGTDSVDPVRLLIEPSPRDTSKKSNRRLQLSTPCRGTTEHLRSTTPLISAMGWDAIQEALEPEPELVPAEVDRAVDVDHDAKLWYVCPEHYRRPLDAALPKSPDELTRGRGVRWLKVEWPCGRRDRFAVCGRECVECEGKVEEWVERVRAERFR